MASSERKLFHSILSLSKMIVYLHRKLNKNAMTITVQIKTYIFVL